MEPELVSSDICELGEGICLSNSKEYLGWLDIVNKTIFIHDLKKGETLSHTITTTPSTILRIQRNIVFLIDDLGLLELNCLTGSSTRVHLIGDLSNNHLLRANDACIVSNGDIFFGTMLFQPEKGTGGLYRISDGVVQFFDKLTIPNTFVQLKDRLLVSDSYERIIYSYNLCSLNDKEIWYDFSDKDYAPDGGTLASNGYIYIAMWGGHGIAKFDQSGKLLEIKDVDALQPTNCVELNDYLYITSATEGLTEKDLTQYKFNGQTIKLGIF